VAWSWVSFCPSKHRYHLTSRLFPAETQPDVSWRDTLQSLRITTRSSAINPTPHPLILFSVTVWRAPSPPADLNVTSSLQDSNKNEAIVNWQTDKFDRAATLQPQTAQESWQQAVARHSAIAVFEAEVLSLQRFVGCFVCEQSCADWKSVKQEDN